MAEPTAARKQGLDYLVSVVHDPEADPVRRDKCAGLLAQLSNFSLGLKGPSNNAAALPVAMNGDAVARRKARENEILRVSTDIERSGTASRQVLVLLHLCL